VGLGAGVLRAKSGSESEIEEENLGSIEAGRSCGRN